VANPDFASQVLLLFGGVTPTTHINKVRHKAVGGSQQKRKRKKATWANLSTLDLLLHSQKDGDTRNGRKGRREEEEGHCERER